jgi:hypothetical protein
LFREISLKKLSVRDSEKIARSIAQDRVRKQKFVRDPRIRDYEKKLSENLGTRVQIEQKENGGKITIDYFSVKDLESILASVKKIERESGGTMMDNYEREQAEIDSREAISNSGPINFMTGEINTYYSMDDNEDILVDDENISKEQAEETIDIPETVESVKTANEDNFFENKIKEDFEYKKELPVFEHNKNEEIVEYKEELPEYKHNVDEELSLNNQFNINTEKNNINPGYIKEENIKPVAENNYETRREEYFDDSKYMVQNQNIQVDNSYGYRSQPQQQNINQQMFQQNQQQGYVSQQQPRKKGFFGKLFG